MTSTARAWLLNGVDHALRMDLDARGRIAGGRLLRKHDLVELTQLHAPAQAGEIPHTRHRLQPHVRAELHQLWQQRPGRGRTTPDAVDPRTQRRHVTRWLHRLGIGTGLLDDYRPPACLEARLLRLAGTDLYRRPLWLQTDAARAWQRMRSAAGDDGIRLHAVSGFRSIDYQAALVARKLARGEKLSAIVRISALPGYSEHHLGDALDLHDGEGEPLLESFETTPAFAWLRANAGRHGFRLSYPRGNPWGISYEPWHWRYHALLPASPNC